MVNPSFNSIYKSNERIELTLSALVANMKRIEEKLDRLLSERNAESQNVINTTAAPPQREPVSLDEVTYSCLRSPLERDLQKPVSKDQSYRKSWYIEEFIEYQDPSLAIDGNDSVSTRDRKETRVRTISNQLNNYTKTAVSLLIQNLDEMNQKCYQNIELIAKKAKLNLDRCIDSWGAKVLAANHYPNATRKPKVSLIFT
ncbi:hypothetical protein BD770DRAFT_403832 [Pilaira anomala]|nr:hypothetical protein BD770DRAFT_403832 [Pilaira anomala]